MDFRWLWNSPFFCIIVATFLWFLSSALVGIIEKSVPVLETVFLRSALSIAILATAGWLLGESPILGNRKNWLSLFLRGLTVTLTWICVFGALLLISLGDALALLFSSNALIALTAWLFRLDRNLQWFAFLGVGSSVVGIIFITHPPFLFGGEEWTPHRTLGLILGLLSTLSVTVTFLLVRFIGMSESALTITIWTPIVSIFVSSAPLAFGFPQSVVWDLRVLDYCLVGLCTVTSICAQIFNTRGIQLSSATLTSTINSLEVVLGRLADVLIFHSSVIPLAVLGTVMSFVGAVTVTLGGKKRES